MQYEGGERMWMIMAWLSALCSAGSTILVFLRYLEEAHYSDGSAWQIQRISSSLQ